MKKSSICKEKMEKFDAMVNYNAATQHLIKKALTSGTTGGPRRGGRTSSTTPAATEDQIMRDEGGAAAVGGNGEGIDDEDVGAVIEAHGFVGEVKVA